MQAPNINAYDGTPWEFFEDGLVGKYGRSYFIQAPLFVVDAGFLEYFSTFPSFTNSLLHRIPLTYGSVEYQFQGNKQAPIAMIVRIRALSSDVTKVAPELGDAVLQGDDEAQRSIGHLFFGLVNGFYLWMQGQQQLTAHVNSSLPTGNELQKPNFDQIKDAMERLKPKRPGRQSWPEDNWAWEQVNTLERPREEVRKDWQSRLSPDRTLNDINRSYRYAIDERRKRKN